MPQRKDTLPNLHRGQRIGVQCISNPQGQQHAEPGPTNPAQVTEQSKLPLLHCSE